MHDRLYLRLVPLLLVLLAGTFHLTRHWWRTEEPLPLDQRPVRWAEPLSLPGVDNLHEVSSTLFRGEQPTAEGLLELKERLGVKTVVNLRSFHSDREELGSSGLGHEHMTMKAWHPEDKEIVRFLRIVTDPAKTPVFVHCQHGADRTGTMCAVYRIAVEGWPRDDAIAEMTQGGFGYHATWGNLVDYLREFDIEATKNAAGLGRR
jgi:protein tyrosine/serine phosphatase